MSKPRPQSSSPPPIRCTPDLPPVQPATVRGQEQFTKRLASRLDARVSGSSARVGVRPSDDARALSKQPQATPTPESPPTLESQPQLEERQSEQSLTLAVANEQLTQAVRSESAALAVALEEKAAVETRNAAILEESRAREEALENRHVATLEELQARVFVEEQSSRDLAMRLEALQHTSAVLDALLLPPATDAKRLAEMHEEMSQQHLKDAAVEKELQCLREECASFQRQNEELVQSRTELQEENRGLILRYVHKSSISNNQGPFFAPCPRQVCTVSESVSPTCFSGSGGSGCSSGCSDDSCDSEDLQDNSKTLEVLMAGTFATQELRQTVENVDEKLQRARRSLMARESRERCLAYKELCRSMDGNDAFLLEDAIRVARAVGVGASSLGFAEARLAQLQASTGEQGFWQQQDSCSSAAETPRDVDPSMIVSLNEPVGSFTLLRPGVVLPPLSTRPGPDTAVPSTGSAPATEEFGEQASVVEVVPVERLQAKLPAAPPSTPAVPAAMFEQQQRQQQQQQQQQQQTELALPPRGTGNIHMEADAPQLLLQHQALQ